MRDHGESERETLSERLVILQALAAATVPEFFRGGDDLGVGAAAVLELAANGRLRLTERGLVPMDRGPEPDGDLQRAWEMLGPRAPVPIDTALEELGRTLRHLLRARLERRGYLQRDRRMFRTRWTATAAGAAVVDDALSVLRGCGEPDSRTGLLVALLAALGIADALVPEQPDSGSRALSIARTASAREEGDLTKLVLERLFLAVHRSARLT